MAPLPIVAFASINALLPSNEMCFSLGHSIAVESKGFEA